jgi:hypothetical protein
MTYDFDLSLTFTKTHFIDLLTLSYFLPHFVRPKINYFFPKQYNTNQEIRKLRQGSIGVGLLKLNVGLQKLI